MPIRRVEVGVMTFTDDKGITQYALAGQQVRVHSRDIDRFDRLNASGSESERISQPEVAEGQTENGSF